MFTVFALVPRAALSSAARAATTRIIPLAISAPAVGCVWGAAHCLAVRARHVRGLVALLANDDVELYDLPITD